MPRHPLTCHRCEAPLSPLDFGDGQWHACPRCGLGTELHVYPALFRALDTVGAAAVPLTDESSCFYHATRRAIVPCEGCGRFLCELCDVDFNGRHLCPSCLTSAQRTGKESALSTKLVRYDRMAMNAIFLSLLLPPLWFVAPFTGPLAIYLAIRHWRKPLSVLPVSRVRLLLAGILGGLVTLGFLLLFLFWLAKIL